MPSKKLQENEIILKNMANSGYETDDKGNLYLGRIFNMILLDGYNLSPPTPKIYTVDVPGGNGVIDITEFVNGDAVFNNRKQEFTFAVLDETGKETNFEDFKTKVSGLIHGKAFDYQLSFDPGFTYHGRFSVVEYKHQLYQNGMLGTIKINVDAEPYKVKKNVSMKANTYAGVMLSIESGRLPCKPLIKSDSPYLFVSFDGKEYELEPGTHRMGGIIFTKGINELFLYSVAGNYYKYSDFNNKSYSELSKKRFYEWLKPPADIPPYDAHYADPEYSATVYWDIGEV